MFGIISIISLLWIYQCDSLEYDATISCHSQDNDTCTFTCNEPRECETNILQCAEGKDCIVTCSAFASCRNTKVICPEDKDCSVTCQKPEIPDNGPINVGNAQQICIHIIIHGELSNLLTVNATFGDHNSFPTGSNLRYPRTMENSNIYCPNSSNAVNTENPSFPCNINCDGNDLMRESYIHTIQGFNDVHVKSTVYDVADAQTQPVGICMRSTEIYCNNDNEVELGAIADQSTCTVSPDNDNPNECRSNSEDDTCDDYIAPTMSPTTSQPTITPTTAAPTDETVISGSTESGTTTTDNQPEGETEGTDPREASFEDDGSGVQSELTDPQLALAIVLPILVVACICMTCGYYLVMKRRTDKQGNQSGTHKVVEREEDEEDVDDDDYEDYDGQQNGVNTTSLQGIIEDTDDSSIEVGIYKNKSNDDTNPEIYKHENEHNQSAEEESGSQDEY